jgi:hypothetical protein
MTPKTTLAGFGATAMLIAGVDASTLNETPLERLETIANERVEAKQIGNIVETTLPWKGEQGIKVKVDLGEPTISERLADKRKKEVITETVDFGDGGFKVDILLNEKPDTNIFCYQIEGAENYDFFYQPPLTEQEIVEGAERPEDIAGSYAVYHKTLKDHQLGKENYATGKVMHIPRPQVWELNNEQATKEWAELSYTEEKGLCVTARQEFLDKAKYPVRIDPTFGYTTAGASSDYSTGDSIWGKLATSIENGTITSISYYGSIGATAGNQNTKGGLYLASDDTILSPLGDVVNISSQTKAWATSTVSTTLSITAQDYWIAVVANGGGPFGANYAVSYDVGSAGTGFLRNSGVTYPTFNSPHGGTESTALYSIYATYTADAPPASSPADNFWDDM